MRYLLATFAISLGLLLVAGDAGIAQSAAPAPMSKRALRKQDNQECTRRRSMKISPAGILLNLSANAWPIGRRSEESRVRMKLE